VATFARVKGKLVNMDLITHVERSGAYNQYTRIYFVGDRYTDLYQTYTDTLKDLGLE